MWYFLLLFTSLFIHISCQLLNLTAEVTNVFKLLPPVLNGEHGDPSKVCPACEIVVEFYSKEIRKGYNDTTPIRDSLIGVCKTFMSLDVCVGLLNLNLEYFVYIIREKPNLTPSQICSILFQPLSCQAHPSFPDWVVNVAPFVSRPPKKIKFNGTPMKILHLTDIHVDPKYIPGSLAACKKPMCCSSDSGVATKPADAAGYWTDYRKCNVPYHLFLDTLKHINSTHPDINLIYFTGDIIPHEMWRTTESSNKEEIETILQMFKDTFGAKKLFPILGNHEPSPSNVYTAESMLDGYFSPEKRAISTRWILDLAARLYTEHWLKMSNYFTIKKGGYYSYLVRPGFKVIGMNSNVCYTFNWWLMYDQYDPYGQLTWLEKELFWSELRKEQVHILTHIPSGDNTCLSAWAKQYNRILERYSTIIKATFSGHTHFDELRLHYDDALKPAVVNFVGGSLTPYSDINPSYRIYSVDPDTYEVLDYDEYYFNLPDATDKAVSPVWKLLYSFKNAYGVPDLLPESIDALATKMSTDSALLDQYYRFKGRDAPPHMAKGCNAKCKSELICEMVTTVYGDFRKCNELKEKMT